MKLTTIVCLACERAQSLRVLQNLAAVHVMPKDAAANAGSKEDGKHLDSTIRLEKLQTFRERLSRAIQQLSLMAAKATPDEAAAAVPLDAEVARTEECRKLSEDACRLLEERRQATERLHTLEQAEEQLRPWGRFDEAILERLEANGWHYALCACRSKDKVEIPKSATCLEVSAEGDQRLFLVLSQESLAGANLPVASFPFGRNLSRLQDDVDTCRSQVKSLCQQLMQLALTALALLKRELAELDHEIVYESTLVGMGHSGKGLAYIQGYVPESKLDAIRSAARRNGWAIRYQDVDDTDANVPTRLILPKPFRIAQVVLDVVDILPGYREIDVSISLLVFLTIFAGLLVGDAGYGVIFLAACGYALWRHKKNHGSEEKALPLQLGVVMCGCITLWGILSGTWFGCSWGGLPCLQGEHGQDNIKLFCFFLGATHLSLARLWKASLEHKWRDRLGNIGWALFLWANYFSVKALLIDGSFENFTMPTYMYGVGGVLILACAVNWRELGDVIYAPFNFINSLSDILSYIRLYAVGLSTLYIADAFNQMGAGIWQQHWALIPVGLFVILFGHVLNVALATMSVLVHGIRLNTQEFSGHIGVEWAGKAYRPFR